MNLPKEITDQASYLLKAIESDLNHDLFSIDRLNLYSLLQPETIPPVICPIRGYLALLTARKVLPLWERFMPLWPILNDDFEEPDTNSLPNYYLDFTEKILQNKISINTGWSEANQRWYEVGNITEELLENPDDFPNGVEHISLIIQAAMNTMHEALGVEFLGRLKNWRALNDNDLSESYFACDVAGLSVTAWTKATDNSKTASELRLEFWKWWLTEAIPQAWELAQQSTNKQ